MYSIDVKRNNLHAFMHNLYYVGLAYPKRDFILFLQAQLKLINRLKTHSYKTTRLLQPFSFIHLLNMLRNLSILSSAMKLFSVEQSELEDHLFVPHDRESCVKMRTIPRRRRAATKRSERCFGS